MQKLRVANITTDSIVDGQGLRLVVFARGCKRRCKCCHNPETHDLYGGYFMSTKRIINLLFMDPLQRGITFSGGELFYNQNLVPKSQDTHTQKVKMFGVTRVFFMKIY